MKEDYALGVIESTSTWLLMAVRLSPGLTRGTCSRPAGVVTSNVRTGPLLGLTSVMVLAVGLTATTHHVPMACDGADAGDAPAGARGSRHGRVAVPRRLGAGSGQHEGELVLEAD